MQKCTRVFIVDDDEVVIELLRTILRAESCEILEARDGAVAIQAIESGPSELVILDIMMPGVDGLEVLRRLRQYPEISVIVLSARGDIAYKVKCLELGADDYITKPFNVDELIARFRAVRRRTTIGSPAHKQPYFDDGNLKIDFVTRRVIAAGNELGLTPTEYNLLQELVLNAGKVLTHSDLLSKVWGPEYDRETEYLHVYMARLRSKIEPDPRHPKYIITVPGVGYSFQYLQQYEPSGIEP